MDLALKKVCFLKTRPRAPYMGIPTVTCAWIVGFHLQRARWRALKKRTFFGARYDPVTGIDISTAYPNIAKSTQHHKVFAKIPNFDSACYVFLHSLPLENLRHLWGQCFRKVHVPALERVIDHAHATATCAWLVVFHL